MANNGGKALNGLPPPTVLVEIIFYELPKLEQRVRDYFAGKASAETLREDEKWCI